jgi:hypothetical protein
MKDPVRDQEKRAANRPEPDQIKGVGDLQIILNSLKGFNLTAGDMLYSLESKMCSISRVARNKYQCAKEGAPGLEPEPETLIEMINAECAYLESHLYRLNQLNDVLNTLI